MKTQISTRSNLVEKAYSALKDKIISNQYPPGYQALERELCAELQMSRTPVREALIQLNKEELIELIPRQGMRVVPMSPQMMLEIYEVITCLEDKALELILNRNLPTAHLTGLERAVENMETALEEDDLDAWAVADERFHAELFVLCGNSILSSLAATLKTKIQRARMITLRMRPKPVQSNEEHRQMLEHLIEGRGYEARLLHRQHRERASELITERLAYFQLHQV
jgi:DNA-binding GntR family transcriptional regulator